MSARETPASVTAPQALPGVDAPSVDASNAVSASSNGPREAELSTVDDTVAGSGTAANNTAVVDDAASLPLPSPPPPPPDSEDEETESEIEMDMDTEDDAPATSLSPVPPPPAETPPPSETPSVDGRRDGHGHGDDGTADGDDDDDLHDEADSEEEDEAFPPVQRTPPDEETKSGDDDDAARNLPSAARKEPVRRTDTHNDDDEQKSADKSEHGDHDDEDDDDDHQQKRGGRTKTRVDVEADTELVRLVASQASRIAAAEKKMEVWNDWARTLSHRFRSGRALQARIAWLQIVLRDASHGEYDRLTDEIKKLMKVYNVATGAVKPPRASPKRRTKIGFTDPAKRRKMVKHDRVPLEELLQHKDSAPSTSQSPSKKKPEAAATTPTAPTASEKAPLDAAVEEKLMRAALKLAPEFRIVDNKMDVWDKIASTTRGRYETGLRVRHHIGWLVRVFRDAAHPQHPRLTPPLRDVLTKFLDVTGQPLAASGPTTPRGKADTGATNGSKSAERNSQKSNSNGNGSGSSSGALKKVPTVVIRPKGDGMLVSLVLEKRPFALSATAAAPIWSEIAAVMGARLKPEHPKVRDGPTALLRFNVVLRVFNDPSHPNHSALTIALKENLAAYNQIMASFRAKLSVLKSKAMQDDSSEASAEEVKISKPRALGEGADLAPHAPVPPPPVEEKRRTSRSMTVVPPVKASETVSELDRGGYGRKKVLPLNVEADELLLHVLLEKRPWAAERNEQGAAWKDVAAAVQHLNPRILNGVSALGRVKSLQVVVDTPSHVDHGRVTESLRKLLAEFTVVYNARSDADVRLSKSGESSDEDYVPLSDLKKRKEPVASVTSDAKETVVASSPKRLRSGPPTAMPSVNEKASTTISTIHRPEAAAVKLDADDLLLRETLRTRPFHTKRGDGMAVWDEVALAIDQTLGRQAFRTGGRALTRLKKLLAAFRSPHDVNDVRLTARQRERVDLVDTLLKTKWPSDESRLTDKHERLQDRIRDFLEEDTTAFPTTTSMLNANGQKEKDTTTDQEEEAVDDHDDEPLPEMRVVPRSSKELEKLRRMLTDAHKERDQLRVQLETRNDADARASQRHEQVNALQDEVLRLRMAAASDRAAFETHVQSLQDEIASYRTQLTAQGVRLEQERCDHRDELRAIVAMLQSERAAHERDTATMLDVVHREREDRREEFVAMMNLVTRSVLQAEPPAVAPATTVATSSPPPPQP